MQPKFKDMIAWQQAEVLMQPAFIRLIDNIRKQLDESTWKGTYHETKIWADEVPDEVRATVNELQEQLKTAPPKQAPAIEQALDQLPSPYPSYQLQLQHQEQQINLDLWQLCYQICFHNYDSSGKETDSQIVEIDTSLIDDEIGEVDWNRLEDKTRQVVERVFANLPG